MATLDLFKKRPPHKIFVEVDGEKREYLIPVQYTVEEVERILEIQSEKDELIKKEVEVDSIEAIQSVQHFWDAMYAQLLILFNHYHQEVDAEFLQKYVPQEHAVEIIAFFTEQHIKNVQEDEKVKKKVTPKN